MIEFKFFYDRSSRSEWRDGSLSIVSDNNTILDNVPIDSDKDWIDYVGEQIETYEKEAYGDLKISLWGTGIEIEHKEGTLILTEDNGKSVDILSSMVIEKSAVIDAFRKMLIKAE